MLVPDRFWGGIVGAFLAAVAGALSGAGRHGAARPVDHARVHANQVAVDAGARTGRGWPYLTW